MSGSGNLADAYFGLFCVVGKLVQRQCIAVSPQQHGLAGDRAVDGGQNAAVADVNIGDTQLVQFTADQFDGLKLITIFRCSFFKSLYM